MYWWPGRYLTPGSKIEDLDALQAHDDDTTGRTAALPLAVRETGMGVATEPASPSKVDTYLPVAR